MPGFVPNVIIGSSAPRRSEVLVVRRAFVAGQLLPACHRCIPRRAFGSEFPARRRLIRGIIRRDHARARAAFDRHVAHGHALFHRECADGRPAIFEYTVRAAADADPRDQRQNNILRRDARLQRSIHRTAIALRRPSATGIASRARAPLRWFRSRTPALRMLRGSRCGYRRKRRSCPAASIPAPVRSRARCPACRCAAVAVECRNPCNSVSSCSICAAAILSRIGSPRGVVGVL